MKKPLTPIKFFAVVFVISISLSIILVGLANLITVASSVKKKTQNQIFITIGDPSLIGSNKYAYVIKDTENNQEYIVISELGKAISITSRLPSKKEE